MFLNVIPSANSYMIRKVFIVLFVLFFSGWIAYSQSDSRFSASLLKAANKGDSQSQALLAYRLKEGVGVSKDLAEAKRWAQIASQSRNGLGFWLLAQMSREAGESPAGYRKYLESAMSCNYPLALAFFARLYETGSEEFGIEKDGFMALELYREAAEYGDMESATRAGYLYLTIRNDPQSAIDYLEKAASAEDAEAMGMLASLYFNGIGAAKDHDKAIDLYRKAADGGSSYGAVCYGKIQSSSIENLNMPVQECLEVFARQPFSSPDEVLDQITFEYPVPKDVIPVPDEEEENAAPIEIAKQESNPRPEAAQDKRHRSRSEERDNQPKDAGRSLHLGLDLGIGTQMFYGDNDWKVRRKTEMLAFPSVDFDLILWAFSKLGLGLGVNTAPFKGLYQNSPVNTSSPTANFRPYPVEHYAADPMYGDGLAIQSGSYVNLSAMAHLDLMNILFGVKPGRFFDIDAYAGGGVIFGFAYSGNVYDTTFNAGLKNMFSLSKKIRLVLNLHGALVGDSFDGESYMYEPGKTQWLANRKFDSIFGATIGLSFNFDGD